MAPQGRVDWAQLARPSLAGIEPYDPGESRDELKERHGLADLAPLNWNEDLFGPPQHVLDAAAAEVARAALYPEQAYSDFRAAVADWIGVPAAYVVPAHGAQALIGAVAAVFVDPGTAVVIPQPTYGLYAQICAAGGATVIRVPADGLRFDLGAIAAAARAQSARMVWLCDPNNPTGLLIGRDEWSDFLAQLPGPLRRDRGRGLRRLLRPRGARAPRAGRRRRAGRSSSSARSRRCSGWPGCGSVTPSATPRWRAS